MAAPPAHGAQARADGGVATLATLSVGLVGLVGLVGSCSVEEQTATTSEMSRSVHGAASGTTEIAGNITGVSTAAESTTQALTQTRTAVDELSRMAADLRTTSGVSPTDRAPSRARFGTEGADKTRDGWRRRGSLTPSAPRR